MLVFRPEIDSSPAAVESGLTRDVGSVCKWNGKREEKI